MLKYKSGFIPNTFVVIGCGGTGSRLIPLLAQFLKTVNWLVSPKIFAIDFDDVEEKNLLRQNFIRPDIGRNKALVMAERYGRAFDISITPCVSKIGKVTNISSYKIQTPQDDLPEIRLDTLTNAIVILCVDSVEARFDILTHIAAAVHRHRNILVLDSGNENDFGQVVLYNPIAMIKLPPRVWDSCLLEGGIFPIDHLIPSIPAPMLFYENMKQSNADKNTVSCAELDQTLAINAAMATAMMGIIQSFIYNKEISFHKLNISLLHGTTPEYLTIKYLRELSNGYKPAIMERAFREESWGGHIEEIGLRVREFANLTNPKIDSKKISNAPNLIVDVPSSAPVGVIGVGM